MKKLSKDDIQKIFLSSLLLIGLIYCYFTFLIGPLNKQEGLNTDAIASLDAQLADARTKVLRARNLAEDARKASETLTQVNEQIPDGAPIAWFPPRIKAFFERHDIKDSVVRIGASDKPNDPAMADYTNVNWSIDLPQVPFDPLSIALAGLENEEMLLEITRLQITASNENLEFQRVSLGVITLLK